MHVTLSRSLVLKGRDMLVVGNKGVGIVRCW